VSAREPALARAAREPPAMPWLRLRCAPNACGRLNVLPHSGHTNVPSSCPCCKGEVASALARGGPTPPGTALLAFCRTCAHRASPLRPRNLGSPAPVNVPRKTTFTTISCNDTDATSGPSCGNRRSAEAARRPPDRLPFFTAPGSRQPIVGGGAIADVATEERVQAPPRAAPPSNTGSANCDPLSHIADLPRRRASPPQCRSQPRGWRGSCRGRSRAGTTQPEAVSGHEQILGTR
jgi:hypothetical protein